MAIIKSHLFNKIQNKLGFCDFRTRKHGAIELGKHRIPTIPYTTNQKQQQNLYRTCLQKWQKLTPQQKQAYQTPYLPAYQNFMQQCLTQTPDYVITIDNTQNSNTLTNYPVILNVQNDPDFFTKVQNPTYMELYLEKTMKTLVSFWIEEWDDINNNAKIWINIPEIPASSTTQIYLKANPDRTTPLSSGNNTFTFFDNFTTDLTKWIVNASDIVIENNTLKIPAAGDSAAALNTMYTADTFTVQNYAINTKLKTVNNSSDTIWYIGFRINSNTIYTSYYSFSSTRDFDLGIKGVNAGTNVGQSTGYNDVYPQNTWHYFTYYITNTTMTLEDINTPSNQLQSTDNFFDDYNTAQIGFSRWGNAGDFLIDYIFLRKLSLPEPTTTYTVY